MTRIGSSDLDIAPLNFGGNVFGWTADRTASFELLDAFRAGGGDFIDTSDSYSAWVPGNSGGESERMIGEWLAARGGRDQIVIATKVARAPQRRGLRSENVRAAVDDSLMRLGTDYIDLYYAHFDDELDVPIEEIAGVFSELVDAGKVRYPAISNFSPERIDGWMAAVAADGLHAPVALQPHYNLVERDFETNGMRAAAERYDLGVFPYYALASGFLTGKYRRGAEIDSPRAGAASAYLDAHSATLEALDAVAARHGASVTTVALAWLRHQPTVVAPIASASKVEQLPDLLASMTLDLSATDLSELVQS